MHISSYNKKTYIIYVYDIYTYMFFLVLRLLRDENIYVVYTYLNKIYMETVNLMCYSVENYFQKEKKIFYNKSFMRIIQHC